MSNGFEVRRLGEEDAEALWHLRLTALECAPQAFRESAESHRRRTVSSFGQQLKAEDAVSFVCGAFDESALMGMAGFYRKDLENGWIWGVFVLPRYRASGVGFGLIRSLLERARILPGLKTIHLTVGYSQQAAVRLYQRCGFSVSEPLADTPDHEMHMIFEV